MRETSQTKLAVHVVWVSSLLPPAAQGEVESLRKCRSHAGRALQLISREGMGRHVPPRPSYTALRTVRRSLGRWCDYYTVEHELASLLLELDHREPTVQWIDTRVVACAARRSLLQRYLARRSADLMDSLCQLNRPNVEVPPLGDAMDDEHIDCALRRVAKVADEANLWQPRKLHQLRKRLKRLRNALRDHGAAAREYFEQALEPLNQAIGLSGRARNLHLCQLLLLRLGQVPMVSDFSASHIDGILGIHRAAATKAFISAWPKLHRNVQHEVYAAIQNYRRTASNHPRPVV